MKYLLDTAVFLWAIFDQRENLTPKATRILKRKGSIFLSAASCWEMAIKYSLGKMDLQTDLATLINNLITKGELQSLSITEEHALETANLPWHHRDPFDRLLIAQSRIEDMPLITPDSHFKKYDVKVLW